MNKREIVVRIIQPAEKPRPRKIELMPSLPEKDENFYPRNIFRILGFTAISALGIVLALNFFNFGSSLNDVMIIIGIPLLVGILTSYVIR